LPASSAAFASGKCWSFGVEMTMSCTAGSAISASGSRTAAIPSGTSRLVAIASRDRRVQDWMKGAWKTAPPRP
jgi:hypothetical protein